MMISKSGMRIIQILCIEPLNIGALAQKLQRSVSWTSEAVTALERGGFVERVRNGAATVVRLAPTQHVRILQAMITDVPGMDYEQFLYGKRLLVLWTLLYEAKSVKEIAQTIGMRPAEVRWHLRPIYERSLLWHEKGRYFFAKKGRPALWEFLHAYRNYTPLRVKVVWKLGDELLFQTLAPVEHAVPGGFMAFADHGVRYGSLNYTWFLPQRKLSVEEIAVQGLAQVDDPRDLDVCVTFVFKHRLLFKQLEKLAVKYDCREKLKDLFTVMWSSGRRIETEHLPPTSRQEIEETMGVYKVKRYVPKRPARIDA